MGSRFKATLKYQKIKLYKSVQNHGNVILQLKKEFDVWFNGPKFFAKKKSCENIQKMHIFLNFGWLNQTLNSFL